MAVIYRLGASAGIRFLDAIIQVLVKRCKRPATVAGGVPSTRIQLELNRSVRPRAKALMVVGVPSGPRQTFAICTPVIISPRAPEQHIAGALAMISEALASREGFSAILANILFVLCGSSMRNESFLDLVFSTMAVLWCE